MDSSTGLAPHLNNPPWLVDIQRIPYEEKWQKKVPGREVCFTVDIKFAYRLTVTILYVHG